MQPDKSSIYSVPAPVGGWNARDAISEMPETDALILDNAFPESQSIRVFGAGQQFNSSLLSNTGDVATFVEHVRTDGTSIGITSDLKEFDLVDKSCKRSFGISGTVVHNASNRWQSAQFRNSTILVCGTSQPWIFNGTTSSSGFSLASYSGIANPAFLVNVDVYKSRLYFIQRDSLSIWYGGVNSITGALTEYDISGIVRKGGFAVLAGSWTRDLNSGLQDMFVIVTSQGEVITFSGDNPGASNWQISGRFYIGKPLGYRSRCQLGADMCLLTTEGIVSLADVIRNSTATTKISDKIQNAFSDAVKLSGSNFNDWSMHYSQSKRMLVVAVPVSYRPGYSDSPHQYFIMNTFTGAWCRTFGSSFYSASPVCVLGDRIVRAAAQTNNALSFLEIGAFDGLLSLPLDIQGAYSSFGDRGKLKLVKSLRPYFRADGDFSAILVAYGNFQSASISTLAQGNSTRIRCGVGGSYWGSAWGSSWAAPGEVNSFFYGVASKPANFISYRIFSNDAASAAVGGEFTAMSYLYEPGGII